VTKHFGVFFSVHSVVIYLLSATLYSHTLRLLACKSSILSGAIINVHGSPTHDGTV